MWCCRLVGVGRGGVVGGAEGADEGGWCDEGICSGGDGGGGVEGVVGRSAVVRVVVHVSCV